MSILILKSLHIISFTAWFAGLFYLIRIFVYHIEALQKEEQERNILLKQFKIMEERVFKIICRPAMIATWIFGLAMIFQYGMDWFKASTWLHIKLVLLLGLSAFTDYNNILRKKMLKDETRFTSFQMRLWNEIPTLFLFSIVLLAVLKNLNSVSITLGVIFGIGLALYLGAKFYKRQRFKNQ